jgi:hypothetical protein
MTNVDLIGQYNLGIGALLAVAIDDFDKDPGLDDLGTRVLLMTVPQAEVDVAAV